MRNWRNVWLCIVLGVLVGRVDVWVRARLGLGDHVALTLLKHGGSLRLVLAVLGHNLLELVVLVVYVRNLFAVRWNQEPLVHVDHVNVHEGVLLLKTLGVAGRLVARRETPANLHTKLLILLRLVWTDKRNARVQLPWNSQIVLLERTHLKETSAYFLS